MQTDDEITLLEAASSTFIIQDEAQFILTRKGNEAFRTSLGALPHLPNSLKKQLRH